jgi:hypothetical protein
MFSKTVFSAAMVAFAHLADARRGRWSREFAGAYLEEQNGSGVEGGVAFTERSNRENDILSWEFFEGLVPDAEYSLVARVDCETADDDMDLTDIFGDENETHGVQGEVLDGDDAMIGLSELYDMAIALVKIETEDEPASVVACGVLEDLGFREWQWARAEINEYIEGNEESDGSDESEESEESDESDTSVSEEEDEDEDEGNVPDEGTIPDQRDPDDIVVLNDADDDEDISEESDESDESDDDESSEVMSDESDESDESEDSD